MEQSAAGTSPSTSRLSSVGPDHTGIAGRYDPNPGSASVTSQDNTIDASGPTSTASQHDYIQDDGGDATVKRPSWLEKKIDGAPQPYSWLSAQQDAQHAEGATTITAPPGAVVLESHHTLATDTQAVPGKATHREAQGDLREFESRRRRAFTQELINTRSYWKALIDLVKKDKKANDKVVNYVKRRIEADRTYASVLYSLGDRAFGFKSGTTEARMGADRQQAGPGVSGSQGVTMEGQVLHRQPTQPEDEFDEVHTSKSVLMAMVEYDAAVGQTYDELADTLEAGALDEKLKVMAKETDKDFDELEKEGNAVLGLMQQCDENASSAYNAHFEAVERSLHAPLAAAETPSSRAPDIWLADLNYRTAVFQQRDAFLEGYSQLSQLYQRAKAVELRRRSDVRDALKFMIEKQTLWRTLPAQKERVLLALDAVSLDSNILDEEIKDNMIFSVGKQRKRDKAMGNDHGPKQRARSFAARDAPDPVAAAQGVEEATTIVDELEHPLKSPLVRHMAVVEHKAGGAAVKLQSWKLALAVLTHDSYLHLFDLPKTTQLSLDSSVSQAFGDIMQENDTGSILKHKRFHSTVSTWKPLEPATSLYTASAEAAPVDDGKLKHQAYLDITETTRNQSIMRHVKDTSVSKWRIRSRSKSEMLQWASLIGAQDKTTLVAIQAASA